MTVKNATAQQDVSSDNPRLLAAGYIVCGSGGDTRWHWCRPNGRWHDGYASEYAAAKAALRDLDANAETTKETK